MILEGARSPLGIVFAIYAGFWAFVLIALFVGVGFLIRKRERTLERRGQGH